MADVVFILVIVGFFALCVGLVVGCDRIVRADWDSPPADVAPRIDVTDEVAA
jgi:hypothetical protein